VILFSGDTLNQGMAPSKILSTRGNKGTSVSKIWTQGSDGGCTLVISVVAASISRSSAERSAKPGRTCFAWSFSRATTKVKGRR
jgi:hypothetical protein